MPVIFCILGYLVIWAALQPFWELGTAYVSFLISDEVPVFHAELTSTYQPEAVETAKKTGTFVKDLYKDVYTADKARSVKLTETGLPVYEEDLKDFEDRLKLSFAQQYPEAAAAAAEQGFVFPENSGQSVSVSTSVAMAAIAARARAGQMIETEPYRRITDIEFPVARDHYAQLTNDRIGLDAPVYWYDSEDILKVGVGQSLASKPPGYGRLILLSAHNTTYFRCLKDAAVGDVIHFDTNYENYEYIVTDIRVLNEVDLEEVLTDMMLDEEEVLVMYTCYPFHVISGRKTNRLVVTARRVSGINIKWRGIN